MALGCVRMLQHLSLGRAMSRPRLQRLQLLSTRRHEKIRFISVLVADSKAGNEENWHISDFELNVSKYRSIKVHDSWHAFMANTPNIWYPSPDRLSVHLALLQALFWVAAKRIRCRNHDELLHLRWVKHQSGCPPTRRRCSMVQRQKQKDDMSMKLFNRMRNTFEYFWYVSLGQDMNIFNFQTQCRWIWVRGLDHCWHQA